MQRHSRHGQFAIATLMSLTLFAACGGGDDSATSTSTTDPTTNTASSSAPSSTTPVTLTPITDPPATSTTEPTPSTYTIVAGDSLYAIAEKNGVTLDDLVAANGWSDGIDHLILPGDVINLPTPGSDPSGDGGTTEGATGDGGGYDPATSGLTILGGHTDPITDPLVDGLYFSDDYASDGSNVTFTLTQYFICDSEANVPAEVWAECVSGFGTLDDPSAQVTLASNASVTIATGDSDDQTLSTVTPAEFARLVSGATPGADAPSGYEYVSWLVWAKVEAGSVVAVEQFYTS